MNLSGIVAVAGRSGLFKLLGQNKSGFILESLDDSKIRIVVNIAKHKFSSLDDTTIFATDGEDIKLASIFERINEFSDVMPNQNTDNKTLWNFFDTIEPKHDKERVYVSDIKKIISWYQILKKEGFLEATPASSQQDDTIQHHS